MVINDATIAAKQTNDGMNMEDLNDLTVSVKCIPHDLRIHTACQIKKEAFTVQSQVG